MTRKSPLSTAVVVGAGFYGVCVALYLKEIRKIDTVILIERGEDILTRSSFINQARVHNGYHYPRSFTTAYRSVANAPRFIRDFPEAIVSDFTSLYALASRNSKITPRQMERFCREIGARLQPAPPSLSSLFNPSLIERVYVAEETAFDAGALRCILTQRLAGCGVEVRLQTEASGIDQHPLGVTIRAVSQGARLEIEAHVAFSCTYGRLGQFANSTVDPPLDLKHELAELVLVEPPRELVGLAVTVMDGPFFSITPFPPGGLHMLSHVRYTPHLSWREEASVDPYEQLKNYEGASRADRMIRDAARYLPCLQTVEPARSLMEVKTVLVRSEGDDGRPILLQRHGPHGRMFSVLGGKLDNIYDVLESLDAEALPTGSSSWTR